jgi:hypothetical protein
MFWRPQAAMFVNAATLLPVLMPLAPTATVLDRFPDALAGVLMAHGIDASFVDRELRATAAIRLDKTHNRSVLGTMNEFVSLAEARQPDERGDLLAISCDLAGTPCGQKGRGYLFPDHELLAVVAAERST